MRGPRFFGTGYCRPKKKLSKIYFFCFQKFKDFFRLRKISSPIKPDLNFENKKIIFNNFFPSSRNQFPTEKCIKKREHPTLETNAPVDILRGWGFQWWVVPKCETWDMDVFVYLFRSLHSSDRRVEPLIYKYIYVVIQGHDVSTNGVWAVVYDSVHY